MKALVEVLAFILLAVPVALLILFNAPGFGIMLAIFLVAAVYFVKTQKATAPGKTQELQSGKDAAYRRAA